MQRKPIANKYRKGTMKSTLHSTYAAYSRFGVFTFCVQAPKGVKERVKSPYRKYLCFIKNIFLRTHKFIFYVKQKFFYYSAKYNRTERLCIFLMVASYCVNLLRCMLCYSPLRTQLSDPS